MAQADYLDLQVKWVLLDSQELQGNSVLPDKPEILETLALPELQGWLALLEPAVYPEPQVSLACRVCKERRVRLVLKVSRDLPVRADPLDNRVPLGPQVALAQPDHLVVQDRQERLDKSDPMDQQVQQASVAIQVYLDHLVQWE